MKGKWAQGLRPRAFTWVIKDRIGVSERPGGYARNHRKVRRDEELIWLQQNGFTHVLSLLDSPHNLSAYEEAGIAYEHVPLGRAGAEGENLGRIFEILLRWYADPNELVLVHHEEFGDRVGGVIGGFLLAAGLLESAPTAVAVTERLIGRQLGPEGRSIVRATIEEGLAPRVVEEAPLEVSFERRPGPTKINAKPRTSKAAKKTAPKKAALKKAARKKAAPKKAAPKKAAPKKAAPKKAAPKKAAPKRTAPKKAAPKKAAPKKPAPKKPAPRRPAPRRPAPRKTAPKKTAARKMPGRVKVQPGRASRPRAATGKTGTGNKATVKRGAAKGNTGAGRSRAAKVTRTPSARPRPLRADRRS